MLTLTVAVPDTLTVPLLDIEALQLLKPIPATVKLAVPVAENAPPEYPRLKEMLLPAILKELLPLAEIPLLERLKLPVKL